MFKRLEYSLRRLTTRKRNLDCNKTDKGIVGDVAFDEVSKVAKALTPVPGGVGPMTIACLLKNTIDCFKRSYK